MKIGPINLWSIKSEALKRHCFGIQFRLRGWLAQLTFRRGLDGWRVPGKSIHASIVRDADIPF